MKNGKHAATEVPVAVTMEQCWELVETSEKTKKHCMMLENCCYDFFELLTLNMTRNGLFGDLVHAEGAYIHDLTKDWLFNKNAYADMWRLKENAKRNGSLYPTHGLGPIAQCMNINRGDLMDYLVSVSSNDFTMGNLAREMASKDEFFNEYVGKNYRGNMNTTTVKTKNGKTMMIQHDVSTLRPYSRIHLISGTKGAASKWPSPERIALGHSWIKPEELKKLYEQYSPPIVKHIDIGIDKVLTGGNIPIEIERWIIENGLKVFETETIYVDIPKGIDDNELIVLKEKGNINGEKNVGDIKLFVRVENTTDFQRNGLDLIYEKTITLKESLCGFSFELNYINGRNYTINNNTGNIIPPEFKKVIPKMGLERNDHHGNLIIIFHVLFPLVIPSENIEKIRELL
jgi:hypothetical protein